MLLLNFLLFAKKVFKTPIFANCGAKLRLFLELTKYFLYFCRKHLFFLAFMKFLEDFLKGYTLLNI